ncbi:uncharacterized protein LOC118438490 [Folsomia candida]|uniref:uncharacterized protein LOC118438490 n=1 Tax=Folsomia candida TaxID=158441 RepID=UPI001604B027|nr:uncharacterized protein LOC118438490 [Folsomia candida]
MYLIDGYSLYRFDRTYNSGVGTLFYIKSHYNVEFLDTHFAIPEHSECNILKLQFANAKPMLICCMYIHPNIAKNNVVVFFRNVNAFLCSQNLEYFIIGDLNLDLLKKCPESFQLFFACKEFGLWQLIDGLTFKGQSLLDHMYTNRKVNIIQNGHHPWGGTDHDLTFVVRKVSRQKMKPMLISYRNYQNVDPILLSTDIAKYRFDISASISEQMLDFNNYVLTQLDKYAPVKKRYVKPKMNNWYTSELSKLRKQRDKLHKLAHTSKSDGDFKKFRWIRNRYNTKLTQTKKYYYNVKFKESAKCTVSLWNNVNNLTGFRKKQCISIPKLVLPNNVVIDSPERINEKLAEQFIVSQVSKLPANDLDLEINNYCRNYNNDDSVLQTEAQICEVSTEEV